MATTHKKKSAKTPGKKPTTKRGAQAASKKKKKTKASKKSTSVKSKTTKKTTTKKAVAKKTAAKKKTAVKKTKTASPKAAATSKKTTTPKKAAAKPPKPAKPSVDPELQKTIRDALVRQRNQILSVVQSTQAQMAEKDVGLADVSDRASGGFEDEMAMGLMRIEAAQIDDIEAAIKRIDDGIYGICVDCGKAIPRKRLEVLPFAKRCLNCKGTKERRAFISGASGDND